MQFGHDGIFSDYFSAKCVFFSIYIIQRAESARLPRKREAGALFTLEHIEKKLCGFCTGKALFCRGFGKNTY